MRMDVKMFGIRLKAEVYLGSEIVALAAFLKKMWMGCFAFCLLYWASTPTYIATASRESNWRSSLARTCSHKFEVTQILGEY